MATEKERRPQHGDPVFRVRPMHGTTPTELLEVGPVKRILGRSAMEGALGAPVIVWRVIAGGKHLNVVWLQARKQWFVAPRGDGVGEGVWADRTRPNGLAHASADQAARARALRKATTGR